MRLIRWCDFSHPPGGAFTTCVNNEAAWKLEPKKKKQIYFLLVLKGLMGSFSLVAS